MKKNKKLFLMIAIFLLLITLSSCGKEYSLEKPIREGMVNGWFTDLLVKPIACLMNVIIKICGSSYALGLLLTTIIVRTIGWPIYAKSNDMTVKMQLMQPEIDRIQSKYVTRKDPESQQKMQMEIMSCYKKYGVSMFGCLMPFVQMPLFMAMYNVAMRFTIARGTDVNGNETVSKFIETLENGKFSTKFLWMDLSKTNYWPFINWKWTPENLKYIILPIIVGGTMFLQNWLATRKPKDVINRPTVKNAQQEQSKKMMMYMQIFMIIMMVVWSFQSAALAFYWMIGNVYSLFQQIIGKKLSKRKLEKLKQKDSIIG